MSSNDNKRRRIDVSGGTTPLTGLQTLSPQNTHVTALSPIKQLLSTDLMPLRVSLNSPHTSTPQSLSSLYSNKLFPLGPPSAPSSAQPAPRNSPFAIPQTPLSQRSISSTLPAPKRLRDTSDIHADSEPRSQVDHTNPLLSRRFHSIPLAVSTEDVPSVSPSALISDSVRSSPRGPALVPFGYTPSHASSPTHATPLASTPTHAGREGSASISTSNNTTLSVTVMSALTDPTKVRRTCKCKNSACLKLYCECFASGSYCNGCDCKGCHNRPQEAYRARREMAVAAIRERNPNAFTPKVSIEIDALQLSATVRARGCRCRRSHCQKRYCECFEAGVPCGPSCICHDCKNRPDMHHHVHETPTSHSRDGLSLGLSPTLSQGHSVTPPEALSRVASGNIRGERNSASQWDTG